MLEMDGVQNANKKMELSCLGTLVSNDCIFGGAYFKIGLEEQLLSAC